VRRGSRHGATHSAPRCARRDADEEDGDDERAAPAAYHFPNAAKAAKRVIAYVTYATEFKSVGLNLNGVPTDAANQLVISAATVKPEDVRNVEVGVKTEIGRGVTANLTTYNTEIENFQAQVTNASVGVLRGYLANAKRVRVGGVELDSTARVHPILALYSAVAYTDGRYITFRDAPAPLEDTGAAIEGHLRVASARHLSKWAVSAGAEYARARSILGQSGHVSGAVDVGYRSAFSSSATFSRYLVVGGYHLVNARIGFRAANEWTVFVWSRNLLDKDYFELLTAAPGNTGVYVGQPGDARTVGVTLSLALKTR
jgi:iron complex outermembrane recepter protein